MIQLWLSVEAGLYGVLPVAVRVKDRAVPRNNVLSLPQLTFPGDKAWPTSYQLTPTAACTAAGFGLLQVVSSSQV